MRHRTGLALALLATLTAGLMTAGSAPASPTRQFALSGRWLSATGESAYAVNYCGDDGTALCGRLVWLRKDAVNSKTRPYLGKYLILDAPQVRPNVWRAHVTVLGLTIGGSIILTSDTDMTARGCYLIFCKTFYLHKMKGEPQDEGIASAER